MLARDAPDTLLVAAAGVADGRGLADAMMLGADGVFETRLVASSEAAAPAGFQNAILAADGDATVKTRVVDIVRNYHWPTDEFEVRVLRNQFVDRWQGHEDELAEPLTNRTENERYWDAFRSGDTQNTGVFVGEAVGLIRAIKPATIVEEMAQQASVLLERTSRERA